MTKAIARVLHPRGDDANKTIVYIIYGALALILTLTMFSFNNSVTSQNKCSELEVKAKENQTNILALKDVLMDLKEGQKELRDGQYRIETKLSSHMEK